MDPADHHVAGFVDQVSFLFGEITPQDEDHRGCARAEGADGGIGEGLPAFALVRIGLVGAHRQDGIEQQDALRGPGNQVAVVGDAKTDVACSSLKILSSEGGGGTPGRTENARPCAWLSS